MDNLALAFAAAAGLVFLVLTVRTAKGERVWSLPFGLLLLDLALIAQFIHAVHSVTTGPLD